MTWFHNSAAILTCEHENGEVSNTDKAHIYCRDRVNCFNFISYAVNISPSIAHYYKHHQISDFTVHSRFGIQNNQNKVEVISLCLIIKHLLVFKQLTDIYIKTFQQNTDKRIKVDQTLKSVTQIHGWIASMEYSTIPACSSSAAPVGALCILTFAYTSSGFCRALKSTIV